MDAMFAMADMARREADAAEGQDDIEEDDDPSTFFANAPKRKTVRGRAVCHPLADGDFHMCFGLQCEHLSVDRERQLVCTITGLVVGVEHAREHDPSWTGRSTGSANPDDHAGTPLGGWVRRRDMFSASVTAFRSAHTISDAEIVLPPQPSGRQLRSADASEGAADPADADASGGGRLAVKRGALCVDEEPPVVEPAHAKRPRQQRRESWSREALEKLSVEAMHVISALLIVETPHGTASAPVAQPSEPSETPKLDPRLQNPEFVRTVALRKYVKACAEGRQRLDLSVLHDVCLYANEFVRAQREAASKAAVANGRPVARSRRGPGFSGQVRNLIANLIVSLWRAACATPHMRDNKRGNDSFRPFAAGILYSFKRGIYLEDGTCVVPALEALAVHLPALRSPQSTPAAKQLQSSSHRGICSFHRSISSMDTMDAEEAREVRRLFSDAAGQAAFLRALVHQDAVGGQR